MSDVTPPRGPSDGTLAFGSIEPIDLQEEMERSFLDYAMSVIVSRALPDVRDGLIRAGPEGGRKLPKDEGIQRYKGLGEMNAQELWDTTMDPARRLFRIVTLDDAATADQLFSVLMGEDVEARRNFIVRNAKDVRFLDI